MSPNSLHRMLVPLVWCVAVCSSITNAQELESVAPTPVGSGARAAGMADAFVAIADDATAASWNPAGLVQLERPEISLVGSWNGIREQFNADFHAEFEESHFGDNVDLNYFSVVYPLPRPVFGKNVSLALNYQRKYDFTREFDSHYNFPLAARGVFGDQSFQSSRFRQEGGLSTVTPAIAFEVNHNLSLGIALNLWRSTPFGDNSWSQTYDTDSATVLRGYLQGTYTRSKEEYEDFSGENLTIGLLWRINNKWSIGLRHDTAFTGEVDYKRTQSRASLSIPAISPRRAISASVVREDRELRLPPTWALGVAYRKGDRLTYSLDVTTTDWNEFYVKNGAGRRFSLVDFGSRDNPWFRTDFERTYTVRAGFEYVMVPPKKERTERLDRLWTIRGGLFFDQEPATGKSTRRFIRGGGDGKPENFYGFAAGVGLLVNQRINIDAAYQFRYGPGVNKDFYRGIPGFDEDVMQHRVLVSTVIYF